VAAAHLDVVGFGLWVVGCGLWVVGCGLWVVGCGLWVVLWARKRCVLRYLGYKKKWTKITRDCRVLYTYLGK
jgi:hypothetical protein